MEEDLVSNSGELRHKAWSRLKALGVVQLTTCDGRGRLQSRPLAIQQADFEGVLWFFIARSSDIAAEVERNPRVNACCMDADEGFYLSVSGDARLLRDKAMVRDLWNSTSSAWFPGGLEDPELTLLKIAVDHAEVWSRDSNRMVRFFSTATAALLGSIPVRADAHATRM